MIKELNRYRVVTGESKILENNLSKEEADYFLYFFSYEVGMFNLTIEEYFPREKSMGRDADLH